MYNKKIAELTECNERIKDFYEVGPVQKCAVEDFAEKVISELLCLAHDEELRYKSLNDNNSASVMRDYIEFVKEHFGY